jgi:transcriptional regulator GlxA family with amidase domain
MPRIGILCFKDTYLSCAAGFADVLGVGNVHLREARVQAEPFECMFLSETGGPVSANGGLSIGTQAAATVGVLDVVVIPAIHYPGYKHFARFLDERDETYAWLNSQWRRGAWIGANCTGTFLLAQSGLLDGRPATTTWWLDRQFRSRYPKVDLQFRSVLIEAERLLCAGATATFMLQSIRIIQEFAGPSVAAQAARTLLIDISQTGQLPYLPLLAETRHGDALVERAQGWLDTNMTRDITISGVARAVSVSERTLVRRFTSAVGQSPLEYLQSIRLQAARALLETSDMNVQEIAHQIGYQDASSFGRLFRRGIGISPGAYRHRFQALTSLPEEAGS